MGGPKVLFLDEPTRGLDLPAKRDMWSLLRRLAATESVTTLLSSHDAQEISSLCSEISVIAKGRLVHPGAPREMGGDIDAFEERLIEMLTQPERIELRAAFSGRVKCGCGTECTARCFRATSSWGPNIRSQSTC
jgi:oleandomycin transport system ATP-binding protein